MRPRRPAFAGPCSAIRSSPSPRSGGSTGACTFVISGSTWSPPGWSTARPTFTTRCRRSCRANCGTAADCCPVRGDAPYSTGNIAWAALVTFGINFVFGSLVFLTLPSCVVPGSGALLAMVRAISWGLLLGPATWQQALVMLPHSGTLLLEGEGYILATFFGLMMARLVFRRDSTTSVRSNYTQGILLNLKGSILVAPIVPGGGGNLRVDRRSDLDDEAPGGPAGQPQRRDLRKWSQC